MALVAGTLLDAWRALLRSHCVLARTLDQELRDSHGITLSDYDVLVQLRDAPGGRLRMSDLSQRTLLTRSGMTRLVDGLVKDGFVVREHCTVDARVAYAKLTETGQGRLDNVRESHHDGIHRMFANHFSEEEAAVLASLLERIPGVADGDAACCGS